MAFLSFFRKKQHFAEIGINTHLAEISNRLSEQNERLRKIENGQKETYLQLEGIDDFLQSNGGKTVLVDAVISLVDIIGDFYHFAAADSNSPLFEQAQMMNNAAKNAVETAGLSIINVCNEPFDFRLHTVHSTEQDNDIQNGYVIKTLKCGYIYNDEIIRRAVVIINKIDITNNFNEEGAS
jgi:molecular chaperone GrpE (heat shock protein)